MIYFGGYGVDEKESSIFLARWVRRLPVPSWESLASIGRHRSLRLLLWWVLLVPVVARVISDIPETIHVPTPVFHLKKSAAPNDSHVEWKQEEFHLPLKTNLPFSWKLLYFSGVAVVIGNLLFVWKSPRICSVDLSSVGQMSEMETGACLAESLRPAQVWTSNLRFLSNESIAHGLWVFFYQGEEGIYSEPDTNMLANHLAATERLAILARDEHRRRDLLVYAKKLGEWSHFYLRLLTSVSYLAAFLGLLWIAGQNAHYVLMFHKTNVSSQTQSAVPNTNDHAN